MGLSAERRGQHVDFIHQAPQGWRKKDRATNMNQMVEVAVDLEGSGFTLEHHARIQQNKRWVERTGVQPADAKFSVIVPIHNENETLSSTIGALMGSDIPADVHAQFIFVTNGCTDNGASAKIVRDFMQNTGTLTTHSTESLPLQNRVVTDTYAKTQTGNITFVHIDTPKPGKAHALNIGNDLARKHSQIAMAVDSDVFPESDTLPNLYATAHEHIVADADGTGIVSGYPVHSFTKNPSRKSKLLEPFRTSRFTFTEAGQVNGQIFAWDAEMVQNFGGFPEVAIEDYAAGVKARLYGRTIQYDAGVNVWTYKSSSIKDYINKRARYTRGSLQLMALDPQTEEIVRSEQIFVAPPRERLERIFNNVKGNLLKAPFYLAFSALIELGIHKGKREFKKDPTNQSWEKTRQQV